MPNHRYPTDLTDAEWVVVAPLVIHHASGGRPPKHARRELVNAIRYVQRAGCAWRKLPEEFLPWPMAYYYFRRWRDDGTWDAINAALRQQVRFQAGWAVPWSAATLDGPSE